MTVNRVGMEPTSRVKDNVKTAVAAGALTAGIQAAILPREIKAAVKNSLFGQDAFVKNAGKAAIKTIKNLDKAGFEKTAGKINVREAMENAKNMYPEIAATSKLALKAIGRSFAAVATGVLIGKAISDIICPVDKK